MVNQQRERLQLMAAQRTLLEVHNAQDLSALEGREKDFWLQQQAAEEQGQVVDAYFEWLKAIRALEVLSVELQVLEKHTASASTPS